MPYKRKGNTMYVKKGSKWRKVGKSSSGKIKSYQRVLNAIEHGWRPTKNK